VDDSSRGALTAAGLPCGSCGTELLPNSKFCNDCGVPVTPATRSAEYKQVTVLFADVVHSMDIAASVGAERLREIMTELVGRSAAAVKRYGGTVDKFTGDGIMLGDLVGAPALDAGDVELGRSTGAHGVMIAAQHRTATPA